MKIPGLDENTQTLKIRLLPGEFMCLLCAGGGIVTMRIMSLSRYISLLCVYI